MADTFSKSERSRIMAAVRSRGNKATEVSLAKFFRAHGIKGWRRHAAIPGRPDFIFQKKKVAIFVDGCFWHGCAKHCRMPASNQEYWLAKIARNKVRDRRVRMELRARGWKALRIWEHELKGSHDRLLRKVMAALGSF